MNKVVIFIDGAYLEAIAISLGLKAIDYPKFIENLAEGDEILKIYYHNCLPKKDNYERYYKKQQFYNRLAHIPKFEIKLGRLITRGYNLDGKPIFAQKRVDTQLSIDVTLVSLKEEVNRICLVAGDDDFVPAARIAVRFGKQLTLWYACASETHISSELLGWAHQTREMTVKSIQPFLRPEGELYVAERNN